MGVGYKGSNLFDVADLASVPDEGATRAAAINRWNERPYSARYLELLQKRRALPVWDIKSNFVRALRQTQVILLVGKAGSGKTTQIPQFVLEAQGGVVACTQPWSIAATSVSRRVAEEMDVTIGEEVGYCIRFEDCTSKKTVLKYLTDGALVTEAMADPLLRKYKVIVLDEAHECTLATDVLFGIVKSAMTKRPELKVVIISAIHATVQLRCHFTKSILMEVPDMLHPVEIFHAPQPEQDYVTAAVVTAVQIHV